MLKIEGQNVPLIDVEALNSFWTLVHNFKYIIVDPKKLKLFNIYLDGYKFLFEPDNKTILLTYNELGYSREYFKKNKTKSDLFTELKYPKIHKDKLKNLKSTLDKEGIKKCLVTSFINHKNVPELAYNKGIEDNRHKELLYRGLDNDSLFFLQNFILNNSYHIDLGDTRNFKNSDELITKLKYIFSAKLYIGSTCTWSKMAARADIPVYIIFNRNQKLLGKEFQERANSLEKGGLLHKIMYEALI